MREVLALIVTVVVAYVVYSVFFTPDNPEQQSGPPPPDTAFPVTLEIAIGGTQSVIARGAAYKLGVSAVSDSRCPGCPDPGKATAVITIQRGGGKKETVRLATNAAEDHIAGPLGLRAIGVKPDAVAGQTIGKKEYVVSLMVDYAPGVEAVPDTAAAMATP